MQSFNLCECVAAIWSKLLAGGYTKCTSWCRLAGMELGETSGSGGEAYQVARQLMQLTFATLFIATKTSCKFSTLFSPQDASPRLWKIQQLIPFAIPPTKTVKSSFAVVVVVSLVCRSVVASCDAKRNWYENSFKQKPFKRGAQSSHAFASGPGILEFKWDYNCVWPPS